MEVLRPLLRNAPPSGHVPRRRLADDFRVERHESEADV